jgi:hypothetical protein
MDGSPDSGGAILDGLDRRRHLDPRRRTPEYIIRWLLIAALVVFIAFALGNAFGQRSKTSTATAPVASLEVLSPTKVRPGLLFQTRITIRAYRKIKQPTLVMDRGWFEAMTFNGAVPDPPNWASAPDGKVELQYDKLGAGDTLVVWFSWQVNPPNAAHRHEGVILEDGNQPIARVDRNLTVFP